MDFATATATTTSRRTRSTSRGVSLVLAVKTPDDYVDQILPNAAGKEPTGVILRATCKYSENYIRIYRMTVYLVNWAILDPTVATEISTAVRMQNYKAKKGKRHRREEALQAPARDSFL